MLEMHRGLFTLITELDAICKKHGISYYLEGGSLLGAVRHKGFLPWDDDVDLCITRDEFHKLLAVIDRELPANRELYCCERFPNYLRDTVKYTNLDTTVLFRNHILDGNAAGQHIDLFILDPVPSDPEQQAEYKKLATIYSELLTPVYVLCDDIAEHLEEYNYYLNMMEELGRDHVLELLRQKLFTYPDGDDVDTYLLRWGNAHRFFPKDYFGKAVDVEFEGRLFPAPQQYYRFLRAEFGDSWMMVPDQAHQEDHSTFDQYRVPCKTFIADYAPFIDYDKFRRDNARRKRYNLESLPAKLQVQKDNAILAHMMHELNTAQLTAALTQEAKGMLQKEDYGALAAYFEPYWAGQLQSELIKYGLAINVHPDVLHAATLSLIMTGRFGQAQKLLQVNNVTGGELWELILDVRACMLAEEEQRYSDAAALADRWSKKYLWQLNMAIFQVRQGIRDKQDASVLLPKLAALMEHYPDSDEAMKLMGDLLTLQGNAGDAENWYRRCRAITRNGLLLLELPEFEDESAADEASDKER